MKAPCSSAPSPTPKPQNTLDGHLPSEQQRLAARYRIKSKCACTHQGIFKAISWHLLLSKSAISCQAPDSATLTQGQLCTQDSVCHIPWPEHDEKPSRGLEWPAVVHFTFEIPTSFTLKSGYLQLLASSGSGKKKIFLKLWDFPGINKTPPCDSYRQGLPPYLLA